MTVEEFLRTLPKNTTWDLQTIVQEAMREFAKLKCRELLEIVVEKAELKFDRDYGVSINKDSILNAVDLDEFIK